jgi:cell division initiation protein
MEVTPKTLREVEFREKMRGYHPEDVDHFLEQVAAGIEVLQDRLRQAVERAQRAETAAAEAGGTDDTLRKTLVLAQRTADLAVQEAREQAARILASAEQQAQTILADAEEKGRRTLEDTIAECRAELTRLEGVRAQSQHEVDSLQRWLDEHKAHLTEALSEAMVAVERAGILWPAPSTRPIDVPAHSTVAGSTSAAVPPPPAPEVSDPETT